VTAAVAIGQGRQMFVYDGQNGTGQIMSIRLLTPQPWRDVPWPARKAPIPLERLRVQQ
jgi:hypothetical protein